MVERMNPPGLSGQLLSDLNAVTKTMGTLIKSPLPQPISDGQIKEVVKVLERFNNDFSKAPESGLMAKTFSGLAFEKGVEKALLTSQLFVSNFKPTPQPAKDMGQTVNSLFVTLKKEMDKFNRNLRKMKDLKKIRVGQKVEKVDADKILKKNEE